MGNIASWIMAHLDWFYLGILFFATWKMGDKETYSWLLKIVGSLLGIAYGLSLYFNSNNSAGTGIIFWNILFLVPIIRGYKKWSKEDELEK